jgi:hypothetical protein
MKRDLSVVWQALCACVPMAVALRSLGGNVPGAGDASVVRVAGLEDGAVFHALDALVGTLFSALPIGTRAFRMSLASVLALGLVCALAFEIARKLLQRSGESGVLVAKSSTPMAMLLALTFGLSPGAQLEAQIPGGALVGVALVLGTWWSLQSAPALAALLTGLAFAQEPILGAMCIACALLTQMDVRALATKYTELALAFAAGLVPIAARALVTWARGTEALSLGAALGDDSLVRRHSAMLFLRNELGLVALVLATFGLAWLVWREKSRRDAIVCGTLAALGGAALALGAPMGPLRFGASTLVTLLTVLLLVVLIVHEGIARIFAAQIPLANVSGVLALIFLAALPLRMLDETDTRLLAYRHDATATWEDLAFDGLPPKALVLIRDRRLWTRTQAAQATGTLRTDLAVIPTSLLRARAATDVLAREPALATLLRDILLGGAPTEMTLSTLAQSKPLCVEFAHTWGLSLAKHLVPVGLFMQYEAEPRGLSERRAALDGQVVLRDRLARAIAGAGDPELASLTIRALRLRAMSTALTGERASTIRTLEDLRVFAPNDPILDELVKRALVSKGYIEVSDLDPNR